MRVLRVCCLLSTLLLAISACASRAVKEPKPPTSADLAAHGIECHKERATGSLVESTVCTSPQQRARSSDAAQKTKDWMNNVPAGPCVPTEPCH